MEKLGGLNTILGMMPGMMGGMKINTDALNNIDDSIFNKTKSIIHSMTKEERANPSIINAQRRRRIAAGSGRTVQDVNIVLKQYDQMKTQMKGFTKKGKRKKNKFGFF